MKLLMILDREFPPDIRVEKEIKTLLKKNIEVHLACFTRKNKISYEFYNGYHIHRKNISKFIFKSSVAALKLPLYFNFWRRFVNKLYNENHFDYVHINDLPLAQIGYELKKRYNSRLVLDFHENWPASLLEEHHTNTFLGKILSSNKQWGKYQLKMSFAADKIIVVIEEMGDFLEKLGINREKIFVLSNTVDREILKIPDLKADNRYITLFYSGGLSIHRGLQVVIKGLQKLVKKNSNIRLWIVGWGSYEQKLKNLTKNLNLDNHITFLGAKPINEMAKYLAMSDITLIPHKKTLQRDTTIPNKLFEYMLASKPIVSSNVNTVERIINEVKCGLTYPDDSPSEFANCILDLIKDRNKMFQLGLNGNKAVLKKYNWENTSNILFEIYN